MLSLHAYCVVLYALRRLSWLLWAVTVTVCDSGTVWSHSKKEPTGVDSLFFVLFASWNQTRFTSVVCFNFPIKHAIQVKCFIL